MKVLDIYRETHIVDTRTAKNFSTGHIPTSKNCYYLGVLEQSCYFKNNYYNCDLINNIIILIDRMNKNFF